MLAPTDDLKAIRELMEQSTKFISLSGASGIVAGTTAIAGALFANTFLLTGPASAHQHSWYILADAAIIVITSFFFAVFFSKRKAKMNGHKISKHLSKKILYHMGLPMLTGGMFSFILLLKGDLALATSATLVFYGLALINVSKFTPSEVHVLGIAEIALGLLALTFSNYSFLLWIIGFGICHIIYGLIMYIRHDRNSTQTTTIT